MADRTSEPSATKKAVALLAPQPAAAPPHDERTLFQRFCERQGFILASVFVSEGSKDAVPAYARMMDYIRRAGDVEAIAVRSLATLGPQKEDQVLALLELNDLSVKVYLLDGRQADPFGVLTGVGPKPPEHAAEARERIKKAMRSRAIRGEGLGKPPYGYRIGPTRKLEIVPEEAQTVRLIYTLYTQEDQGIRRIVRHLNERRIPTRRGRNWSMVTIRDILRNRAYLGTYTRFGMRVPGIHPAIVTPDMFRWTQSKLEERRPKRSGTQSEPFLLSGLIYCGSCGNRMVGVTRRQAWTRRRDGSRAHKEYRYYQCQSRTNQGVCQYHTRQARELEKGVLDFLQGQRARLDVMDRRRGKPTSEASLQREQRRVEAALTKNEERLRHAIRRVAQGKLSAAKFRPLGADLIRSRRELADRLCKLRDGLSGGPGLGQQAAHAIASLSGEGAATIDHRRAILESLIERIEVHDGHFSVRLRPGLEEPPAAPAA